MKRGRKAKTVKNITFTMSVTPAEAETLLSIENTYQKAIRNLISEKKQKDLNETIEETAKAAKSLMK